MNSRIRRSLISYARKLSLSWEPRRIVKDKAKVAPATHECSKCGNWSYGGTSDKNYEELCEQYPDKTILYATIHMDHIVPVVDPATGATSWDDFYDRLFCHQDNFRALCQKCHEDCTKDQNQKRKNVYFNGTKRKK